MAKVTMTLDPKTGIATYAVEGVMGGACKDITAALTEGKKVLETQNTGEMCEVQERPDYISNLDGGSNE